MSRLRPLNAGVAVDEWKLPTFKRELDEAGFSYTEHPGLTAGTRLLKVTTAEVERLALVLQRAQQLCRN